MHSLIVALHRVKEPSRGNEKKERIEMRYHSCSRMFVLLAGLVFAGCSGDATSSKTAVVQSALTANGVDVTLTLTSDWTAGYCANVVLKNSSSSAVNNWSVVIELNQSTMSQIWSATSTANGTRITTSPLSFNQVIAPGATVSFGFCGAANGTNYRPIIVSASITGGQSGGGTGGASGTGGAKATGGATLAGGANSTGGTSTTGGANSTGGAKATGGAATGGAASTGGAKATGGAATGGNTSPGGTTGTTQCTADTSGKTKFCQPSTDGVTGLVGSVLIGGVSFVATGSTIAVTTASPITSGTTLTGLSPYNTGNCSGAGVSATSLATSQPYTGLGMLITNSGSAAVTISMYIDSHATGGQYVQRKYTFPAVPADSTAHAYNLTWNSTFTDSCTLPTGSSFDQTKILGLGFGVEATTTAVQLNLLVSNIAYTGGGAAAPCSAYCSNPISFTVNGSYSSGNLGTNAACYQTTSNFTSGNCGNFVSPRALFINGTQMNCNSSWVAPAKVNGGYCFYTPAGDYAWAYFGAW
jgi:hypothetical protein